MATTNRIRTDIAYQFDELTDAKVTVLADRYGCEKHDIIARAITLVLFIDEQIEEPGMNVFKTERK